MCNDSNWHVLWDVFNTNRTEEIRVPRQALVDVLRCDAEDGSPTNTTCLVVTEPKEGSRSILVNRAALFRLLDGHAVKRCDARVAQ